MDVTSKFKALNRPLLALTTVALTLLVLTLPAVAAAAAPAEGEASSSLFAGDLGNAIWTLAIFLGLLFVLGRFAWGPILDALQGREDFIRDSLAKAKADRDAAEAKLAQYQGILAQARAEATALVDEGRRDADVLRVKIEDKAKAEAEQIIARARREIDLAKDTAKKELYAVSGELATRIASKIVRRELTGADQQRLIDESISEMKQLGTN